MKPKVKYVRAASITALILCFTCSSELMSQNISLGTTITYQDFYDGLSPYGTWIDYQSYGHVWRPTAEQDFRPYLTNGHWEYSNEGWMWQSGYDWGWAPFHYGRWLYDDSYGWLWIPGYEWSPAWVTWGNVDRYYAWAPLLPEVNVGVAFGFWRPGAHYWNLCSREHIYDLNVFAHAERRETVANYSDRITIINNFSTTRIHTQYYCKGPALDEVQMYTRRPIEPVTLKDARTVAMAKRYGNNLHVYRPFVANPQPREFRRIEDRSSNADRIEEQRIRNERDIQRLNVERLPVHRAPEMPFRREKNTGSFGKNRKR